MCISMECVVRRIKQSRRGRQEQFAGDGDEVKAEALAGPLLLPCLENNDQRAGAWSS